MPKAAIEEVNNYTKELKTLFWENNISVDEIQLEKFTKFAELLEEKNEDVNLVSRKDVIKIVENHIFISALITEFLPVKISKFLDVGTGGGFPGIPLAIMRPMMRGILADSIAKKVEAVNYFINKIKLNNVIAENCRVESPEFIEKYKDNFDLVVSRATCPLIVMFRYSLPLVKDKAFIATLKGGDLEQEIQTAETKYKAYIKKSTIFELPYKPTNIRNQKEKKLILIELSK